MLSFKLADTFIDTYRDKPVAWGYKDAAGNSLGEITFLRTYSRIKPDGTKERWHEVCRRVIEWMFSEQKNWCKNNRLPWNDHKAQRSAQDAYERMFTFKWTPPGRGLWIAGTPLVTEQRNSAAMQNCAFLSTADMTKVDPSGPFKFLMEALMLGVGVGFDDKGADKEFIIYEPGANTRTFVIPDTREGWIDSLGVLLESYLMPDKQQMEFDYSLIRPAGEPIRTFGGTAAGPGPLRELHEMIRGKFTRRAGGYLSRVDIADIGNMIGVCVVSGNVRRSAELLMGRIDDKEFAQLKNPSAFPERNAWSTDENVKRGWSWMSNNSVEATVGSSYDHLIDGIALNGEPGIIWIDISRAYGRLIDPPNNKDRRVVGYNPCLSGDSIIETVDGPARLQDITEPTMVYSRDRAGHLTISKASAAFKTRENARTLRICLQNGDELVCTPDHRIMLRNGTWVEAKDLRPNDSLEVLCRARRGWRYAGVRLSSQSPSEQIMEHRLIWEGVHGAVADDFDVDHINRDHQDNRIENLRILPHGDHSRLSRSQVNAINPVRSTGWLNQHTVISVSEGPVIDVYDLTVEENHCFVANNVVVHNCAEQSLESQECCTLVECYLNRHESLDDFQRTLKYAYLYAKTVTLLPTHWERTNAIMQRNRRIGCSVSGIANFTDNHGLPELRTWLNKGYETVQRYDKIYSEWLGIRESIKTSTVKPSGCRPWDALTTTAQGVLTLEELFAASGHRDGHPWQDFSGYQALQGGGNRSAVVKTYDNGKAEVFGVNLSYGMQVRSTGNHQWWVTRHYDHAASPKSIDIGRWVAADQLRPGDVLEVRPGVYSSTNEASLLSLDSRALSMRADAREIRQPTEMNADLGWLLGYLWGDGAQSPSKYRIRFSDGGLVNLEKVQRILLEQFAVQSTIKPASGGQKPYELCASSKMLWHWLIKNGVWKYYADDLDCIPDVVRRSSTTTLLAFLAGLVDADGHVAAREHENVVILASASEAFARHVQDVALATGIVFGRSHNTGGIWLMCLASETVPERLDLMVTHSTKMSNPKHDLPWSAHRRGSSRTRILGKVEFVESLGEMDTFDIEVADTHWYYAGGIKSHNTVSILAGESPGVHWAPGGEYFNRAIRLAKDDALVPLLTAAGYTIEPDVRDSEHTVVAYFPIHTDAKRAEGDVTIFEKANLAVVAQRYWSDNSVSVTLSFDAEKEAQHVGTVLHMHEGQLKTVSFLPMGNTVYAQQPYTKISAAEWEKASTGLRKVDLDPIYRGKIGATDAVGEAYCTTDSCEIKQHNLNNES